MAAVKFSKQYVQPNPLEVDYWVDVASNPYGAIIKYYDGEDWTLLNGSGGSVSDFDFYTKSQINQLLSNKADIKDVESKLDDIELAEVIKNIEVADVGDDTLQLVIFKYDNNRVAISLPTATATNPGILSGQDFVNFVKQHQLQSLYTEMYDLFADIRDKYQLKLRAGSGIKIDRETSTISVLREVDIDWEDISEEDRKELTGHIKNAIAVDVDNAITRMDEALETIDKESEQLREEVTDTVQSEISAIRLEKDAFKSDIQTTVQQSINSANSATNRANNAADQAEDAKEQYTQYVLQLESYRQDLTEDVDNFKTSTTNQVDYIDDLVHDINDVALDSASKADNAVTVANTAKQAVATLEGLANVDTSVITAAAIVTLVEQNTLDIQNILSKEILLTEEEFEALEFKDPTVKYYIYEE